MVKFLNWFLLVAVFIPVPLLFKVCNRSFCHFHSLKDLSHSWTTSYVHDKEILKIKHIISFWFFSTLAITLSVTAVYCIGIYFADSVSYCRCSANLIDCANYSEFVCSTSKVLPHCFWSYFEPCGIKHSVINLLWNKYLFQLI